METQNIRAVLVPVGLSPRRVEAAPATLWSVLGGIPVHFASFALTRFGRRFAAVWCHLLPDGDPNRFVAAPMFRYREVNVAICGPILITAANVGRGEALSLNEHEVARCIAFATSWPMLKVSKDAPDDVLRSVGLEPRRR